MNTRRMYWLWLGITFLLIGGTLQMQASYPGSRLSIGQDRQPPDAIVQANVSSQLPTPTPTLTPIPPVEMTDGGRIVDLTGIWGGSYTQAVRLGDYIFTSQANRLVVLSYVDPNRVEVVGGLDLPALPRRLVVFNQILYLLLPNALYVADVSSPTTPQIIYQYPLQNFYPAMSVDGEYIYLISNYPQGLQILHFDRTGGITEAGSLDLDSYYTHLLVHNHSLYLAQSNQLIIVNISNPTQPKQIGQHELPWSVGDWVFLEQALAVFNMNSGSVVLYDVSSPDSPREIARHIDLLGRLSAVEGKGSLLYVTTGYGDGITIWDFSDRSQPRQIGSANGPGSYGSDTSLIVKESAGLILRGDQIDLYDFSNPSRPIHLLTRNIQGEYGRVVAATDSLLYMYDNGSIAVFSANQNANSQPIPPTLLGRMNFEQTVNGFSVNGRYGYVAIGNSWSPTDHQLVVVDLQNPGQIKVVRSLALEGAGTHRIAQINGFLYVSEQVEKLYGIRIYDLSNPAQPIPTGFLDIQADAYLIELLASGSQLTFRINSTSNEVYVYNIAAPSVPRLVGRLSFDNPVRAIGLGEQGRVYVATSTGVHLYDSRQTSLPLIYTLTISFWPNQLSAIGNQLYLINYGAILIIDWTQPTAPQIGRSVAMPVPVSQELIFDNVNTLYGSGYNREIVRLNLVNSEGFVIGSSGANLVSQDGKVRYNMPASAVYDDYWLSHAQVAAPLGVLPEGEMFLVGVYENQATGLDSGSNAYFYRPYTMKFAYTIPNTLRASEEQSPTPQLYRWNGSMWVLQPDAVVDSDTGHFTVSVQQTGKWAVVLANTSRPRHTIRLPVISRTSPVDLSISHIEVTQAIQRLDNQVPLVAHRPSLARIYATTTDLDATSGIYIGLEGYRNGQPLPGSPLMVGPWAIYAEPQRGSFGFTVNVPLPLGWTEGNIELTAWVDTSAAVEESNEANNGHWVPVGFHDVPPLDLMLVPIAYTERSTGRFFPAPTQDEVSDWVIRSFPIHQVNISWHAPLAFEGDLSINEEWPRLLDQVTSVKRAEGAPESRIYYGLIPVRNADGESPSLLWAGIGWIGWRASIGVTTSGTTTAHEIGHNFGLPHAPCGNPGWIDEIYPYPNGSIGEYGLDVWQMQIFPPDVYRDVMSYCGPKWFSDYNYVKLFQDQMKNGRSVRSIREEEIVTGLLIRADLSNGAELLPIYVLSEVTLSTPEKEPNRTYSVELADSSGVTLASYDVDLLSAEENGHVAHFVNRVVPFPLTGELSQVRLLRGEQVIAVREFQSTGITARAAPHLTQSESTWTFVWDGADLPALVRYRVDKGAEWTILALDWTGGELKIDPRRLPGGLVDFDLVYADSQQPQSRNKLPSFSLPNQPPTVWIRGEDEISAGDFIYLQGHAYDPEDGVLAGAQWLLDGIPMGNQPILQLNQLSSGEHAIILRAMDGQGQTTEAVHWVRVNP